MILGNVAAVIAFEGRRALAWPRLAWWAVLALFPVLIAFFIRLAPGDLPREPWAVVMFALIPMLVSMLGTFSWTAPAISAELEQHSWTYLAIRPGGRTALLCGKYLAAVLWVMPALLVGLVLSLAISWGELPPGTVWQMGWALVGLACLSCPAYAALYLLLGTLFPRRAMVIAVVYSLIFELVVSLVPALINKLTIQFRLRALLVRWSDLQFGATDSFVFTELIGSAPARRHVFILLGYTAALLLAAVWWVRRREYATSAEV